MTTETTHNGAKNAVDDATRHDLSSAEMVHMFHYYQPEGWPTEWITMSEQGRATRKALEDHWALKGV